MIQFIRKHYILTALALILLGGYVYLYFTDFRYDDDMRDFRHYPIPPLTEKWTKTIEYKTLPKVKVRKCFMLSLDDTSMLTTDMVEENPDKQQYSYLYVAKLTEEQYYAEAREKPHFEVKIYKDDVLLEQKQIYFTIFGYSSVRKFNEKEIWLGHIEGDFDPQHSACYAFSEDTDYKIELTNKTALPRYLNVGAFFTIRPPDFAK